MKDGVLIGDSTGGSVDDCLASHGGLAASKVSIIVATMRRVRGDVTGAGK